MSKLHRLRGAKRGTPSRRTTRSRASDNNLRNKLIARDGYNNAIARLGQDELNALSSSYYTRSNFTQNWTQITTMYRQSWLVKKIIDVLAEDMTKSWITLDTQADNEAVQDIEKEMRKYGIQKKCTQGIKWARLYGGAIGVIIIDGHEDIMNEPLDIDTVMPDTFRGILIFDRWRGVEPSNELVSELGDPDFGLPEYYKIELDGLDSGINGLNVHHSRVLRFIGRELPYVEEENEQYWGASELEHVFEELQKRDATSANIAQLVFQANLRVLKMSDLGSVLSMSDERTQQELHQTVQAQNMLMTSFGLQVLDQGDSFETHPYTFSGLNEIYQSFMNDIAGAAEIPATKLFGKSPDGLNATGESDLTIYYDSIRQKQENDLRPILERLMPIICVSAIGSVPDDLEIAFEPVESPTAEKKAALAGQVTSAVATLYQSDIISKATALKELRKSSFYTGIGASITDEDIETAENEPELPSETDFGGMMGLSQGQGTEGVEGQINKPSDIARDDESQDVDLDKLLQEIDLLLDGKSGVIEDEEEKQDESYIGTPLNDNIDFDVINGTAEKAGVTYAD